MKKSHLVAQLIEKGLKARQICIQLGYCSKGVQHLPSSLSNKMPVVTKHIKENFRLTNIHKEAITCRVCGIVKNSITKSFAVSIVEMADVKINLTDLCNVLHDKSAKFKVRRYFKMFAKFFVFAP